MTQELQILKFVCDQLESAKIPYMLTGSLASHFYAVPRMTRDIDIVIETIHLNIDRFFRMFQTDFYLTKNTIVEAIENEGMFNIIHNQFVFKIDFIIRKTSAYRLAEFQRRRRLQLNHFETWVVSLEDLILSKLFWAKDSLSQLQLNDVKHLLAANSNIDERYLNIWVKELELQALYEGVKADGRHTS